MKKLLSIALTALLVFALLCTSVYAEEEATNYLKATWDGKQYSFAGSLKKSEEDGVTVYKYTPNSPNKWYSPTISVLDAVKDVIGDAEDAEVVFAFEVRGIFKGSEDSTSAKVKLRAVNPATNKLAFPKNDEEFDEDGNSWYDVYGEATDGDRLFNTPDSGGNVFKDLAIAEILSDEWTLVESDPIYISAANVNTDLIKDWILCMDNLQYKKDDEGSLVSIQVRNAAVYNAADLEEAEQPTPEPTEEPTKAPVSTSTATAVAPATETPTTTTNNDASGFNPTGLIIGIVCGVIVIGAVVAFVIIKKKKDTPSE